MKKEKVIIFGTGWAFNNYIRNYRDEYDIIGITDWDYEKHGESIQGITVINPYCFDNYEFDYILIVSSYIDAIKEQLKQRTNIPENKIFVPYKYKLKNGKPFENEKTHKMAREMIFYLSELAKKNDIVLYLEYGTLLGFVRDGDIIQWDDDVDFAINYENVEKFGNLLKNNISSFPYSDELDWYVLKKVTDKDEIRYYEIRFNGRNEDFHEFEFGVRIRRTFDNLSVVMQTKYLSCKAEHFNGYDEKQRR